MKFNYLLKKTENVLGNIRILPHFSETVVSNHFGFISRVCEINFRGFKDSRIQRILFKKVHSIKTVFKYLVHFLFSYAHSIYRSTEQFIFQPTRLISRHVYIIVRRL